MQLSKELHCPLYNVAEFFQVGAEKRFKQLFFAVFFMASTWIMHSCNHTVETPLPTTSLHYYCEGKSGIRCNFEKVKSHVPCVFLVQNVLGGEGGDGILSTSWIPRLFLVNLR